MKAGRNQHVEPRIPRRQVRARSQDSLKRSDARAVAKRRPMWTFLGARFRVTLQLLADQCRLGFLRFRREPRFRSLRNFGRLCFDGSPCLAIPADFALVAASGLIATQRGPSSVRPDPRPGGARRGLPCPVSRDPTPAVPGPWSCARRVAQPGCSTPRRNLSVVGRARPRRRATAAEPDRPESRRRQARAASAVVALVTAIASGASDSRGWTASVSGSGGASAGQPVRMPDHESDDAVDQ